MPNHHGRSSNKERKSLDANLSLAKDQLSLPSDNDQMDLGDQIQSKIPHRLNPAFTAKVSISDKSDSEQYGQLSAPYHNPTKSKRFLNRKMRRKEIKLDRKKRIQNAEWSKRAHKLGISIDKVKEMAQKQKDESSSIENGNVDHHRIGDEFDNDSDGQDDRDFDSFESNSRVDKPFDDDYDSISEGKSTGIKKQKIDDVEDRNLRRLEKLLLIGKNKKIGDGLDFIFDGIGSDADDEKCFSGEEQINDDDQAPMERKFIPNDVMLPSIEKKMHSSQPFQLKTQQSLRERNQKSIYGEAWKPQGKKSNNPEKIQDDDQHLHDIGDSDYSSADDNSNEYDLESLGDEDSQLSGEETLQSLSSSPIDTSTNQQIQDSSNLYACPSFRKGHVEPSDTADPSQSPLFRQIRGHINRLSQGNIPQILEIFEQLFSNHPRRIVTEFLIKCLLDDCIMSVGANQNFCVGPIYAAFVALLHLVVGAEVGGFLVESVGRCFQSNYDSANIPVCRNMLIMFCYLYNFNVLHCSIVYDIVRMLVQNMNEQNVDLLPLLIVHSGPQLRRDDPTALKEIIKLVSAISKDWVNNREDQEENHQDEEEVKNFSLAERGIYSKRVEFIIESLTNLQKKRTAISKIDGTSLDNTFFIIKNHLDSYLRKRFKKTIPSQEPLQISWKDLVHVDKKGRWWMVGSAYQIPSNQLEERNERRCMGEEDQELAKAVSANGELGEIISLADKQHMNTDVRRAIFCIFLTSEDYIDAFNRILRLQLKKRQSREINHVLIHCCLQEIRFNPYYAYIAEKLCSFDRDHKINFKYCLWDKLESLDSFALQSILHLTKLYTYLLGKKMLNLTIFKVVQLTKTTSPRVLLFMKLLLITIAVNLDTSTIYQIFNHLTSLDQTQSLREMLDSFLLKAMDSPKFKLIQQANIYGQEQMIHDEKGDHEDEINDILHKMKVARTAMEKDSDS